LLAVLCLMRYEDWTLRETEVRLSEHRELRRVLQLGSVPEFPADNMLGELWPRPSSRPSNGYYLPEHREEVC
jgi:hypothetical protein